MTAATEQLTIHAALSKVMEDVRAIRKGDTNSAQHYSFRGIDAVVNAVGPVLRKHQVLVVPVDTEANYRDVQTSNGKPSREVTVIVTYRFIGPAGDSIDVKVPGESMDFGDKGAPKAMSVALRIALLQTLCVPTDDPDPDSSSYERASSSVVTPSDVRKRIGKLATAHSLDTAEVAAEFETAHGTPISAGSVEDLTDFEALLKEMCLVSTGVHALHHYLAKAAPAVRSVHVWLEPIDVGMGVEWFPYAECYDDTGGTVRLSSGTASRVAQIAWDVGRSKRLSPSPSSYLIGLMPVSVKDGGLMPQPYTAGDHEYVKE